MRASAGGGMWYCSGVRMMMRAGTVEVAMVLIAASELQWCIAWYNTEKGIGSPPNTPLFPTASFVLSPNLNTFPPARTLSNDTPYASPPSFGLHKYNKYSKKSIFKIFKITLIVNCMGAASIVEANWRRGLAR